MTRRHLGLSIALAILASLPAAFAQEASVIERRHRERSYEDGPMCCADVWFDRKLELLDDFVFKKHERLPVPYGLDHVALREARLRADTHDRSRRRRMGT